MKRGETLLRSRLCTLALAVLLALTTLTPAAYAAEERETVRVGFFAFEGYHMMDENGGRSGYGYDFLRMAARHMDVDFEYVGYEHGWDDMLDLLERGEIDLVTSAQTTADRLETFAFSKPIGSSSAMLTVSSQNEKIIAGDYRTYRGMRVGLLKENSRNEDLEAFAAGKGFSYTPVYFDLATELEQALKDGRIDAACTSSLRKTHGEHVLELFDTSDFYVIVRREDTALLEQINYAIDQLNAIEGDWKNDLNNKYYAHLDERELSFTEQELALIRQYAEGQKTLVVTASPDRSPYSYVENGELKGIIVDYFAQLAAYVGIPYEIAVPADREEFQRWQTEGPADIFMDTRIPSESWMEERGFAYSQPYTTMRLAMVTRRDFDGNINTLAVASAQGVFGIEDGLAPNAKRLEVATREEAMKAVLDGRADAAVAYLYTAQQFVNQDQRGLLTYTVLAEPTYDYRVCFTKKVTHELAGIFTKAIYAMPDGTFENIASGYTSYRADGVTLLTWIRIHPFFTLAVCLTIFALCMMAVLADVQQKRAAREQKRAMELHRLAERAERASRAKSDFLANISHDIRTPMNAIVGITGLMENEPGLSDRLHDYLRKLQSSSRHLLSLFDDVLDMSRIEAEEIVLDRETVSLIDELRQVEDMMRTEAERKGQTFRVCLTPLTHDTVVTDSARLRRILMNLISNAIKYTPEGGQITMSLEELESGEESARFRFTVEDNGMGMSPELVERLFEPFARGEDSVTNKIQGTGLGMTITKNIVDAMGGEILVESAPGKGSRFDLLISFTLVTEEKTEKEEDTLRGRHFLCAEDNELNAEILTELLHLRGASCTIYPNGAELVRAFETAAESEYDAILMDIQMPVMNGLDAARAIRTGENPNGRSIPIIAMTANAFAEDVQRSLDAGMDAHISKPLDIRELNRVVGKLFRDTAKKRDAARG